MNTTTLPTSGSPTGQQTTAAARSHLIFVVADQEYAAPVSDVTRLMRFDDSAVRMRQSTDLPWLIGSLSLATKKIPIVSLRALWGLGTGHTESLAQSRRSIITFKSDEKTYAILVDLCLKVVPDLNSSATQLGLPLGLTGTDGYGFKTLVKWGERLVVLVRLEDLLPPEQLKELDAAFDSQP